MRSSEDSRDSSEDLTVVSPVQGKPIYTLGVSLLEAAKDGRLELIPDMLKKPELTTKDLEAAINAAAEAGHPKVIAAFKDHIARKIPADPMSKLTAPTSKPPKEPLFGEDPDLDTPYEALAKRIDAKMNQAEGIQVGKLVAAAREGKAELISDMLKADTFKKENLEAAIDAAAQAGHTKVIAAFKAHISAKTSVDDILGLDETRPAISNAEFKDLDASINAKMDQAESIQKGKFFDAIKAGKLDDVESLLNQNPSLVEAQNSEGKSGGRLAAELGHRKIVEHLVSDQSERTKQGPNGEQSLEDILIAEEARKQSLLEKKQRIFLNAALHGSKELFDKMLADNPEFATAKDKDGKTALHLAAEVGQKEILAELLKRPEASVMAQAKDSLGRTPLHYAAENGQKEMCDALIDAALKDILTAQQTAERKKYVEQQDVGGRTADHLLANNWHNTKTKMLPMGDRSLKDKGQLTVDDLARAAVYRADIIRGKSGDELGIKRPELLSIPDKDNKNALHFAAQHQNQEALEQILQHENVKNAINVLDKDGKTPLIYAAETGNKALYDTLVKAGADASIEHEGKKAEAILAEAAKRAEEERLKQEAAALKKDSSTPNIDPIDPALKAKMEGQAPKSAGSDSKDRPLSQEDFFAGRVEKLPYQPGEPCKNGEDKFKFDPQTKTSTRAMSDPTKSHVMETANPDGSFKYDVKTVAPDDSPTKIHKIAGDFGTLYFDAKGAMIGAELSTDLEKLKKLDPAQRAQAEGIMHEKLVREEQSRSSGAKATSVDTAEATKTQALDPDGKPIVATSIPSSERESVDRSSISAERRSTTERDSIASERESVVDRSSTAAKRGSTTERDSIASERESVVDRSSISTNRSSTSERDSLSSERESVVDRDSISSEPDLYKGRSSRSSLRDSLSSHRGSGSSSDRTQDNTTLSIVRKTDSRASEGGRGSK